MIHFSTNHDQNIDMFRFDAYKVGKVFINNLLEKIQKNIGALSM